MSPPDWDNKGNRKRALKVAVGIVAVLGDEDPRRLGTPYLETSGADYPYFHAVGVSSRPTAMA